MKEREQARPSGRSKRAAAVEHYVRDKEDKRDVDESAIRGATTTPPVYTERRILMQQRRRPQVVAAPRWAWELHNQERTLRQEASRP